MNDFSKPWKKLKSVLVYSSRYFHLRMDECETSSGKIMPRYFVVDFPDWVQTVALDENKNLIVVDQYRYPGEGVFLEFPGGSTNPDRKEDPLDAAKRELREETGYASMHWESLGFHYPNPALLNNKCHVFLALDCTKVGELELDAFEELEVRVMAVADFEKELKTSKKIHSLMLATFELARSRLGL